MPAYDAARFEPPAPVVGVVIRHPDHGLSIADVPMLIDSGADTTLIPKSAAESVGAAGLGEKFLLQAFDGSISESDAVRVHLEFLGRKFRGRFLVVDSEIGIIGRDILNHVRLLLDGPAKTWEEWPPSPPHD